LLDDTAPDAVPWIWRRSLIEAEPFENSFTVDPVRFTRTAREISSTPVLDYDGDDGSSIRFGDGTFGGIPDSGHVFSVLYRVGSGAIGNVAADSITKVEPGGPTWITAVTNPLAASGGVDEESAQQVKRLAPQAFRAVQYRALRAEDYTAAAQMLPWVMRAGTAFRWTGSWLTVFTTADPRGSESITVAQNLELIELLNRYRMAGYEAYAPTPRYVSLDLYIYVCALADAFRGEVEAAILEALGSRKLADGRTGFFYPDRFSFGTPLERSKLESAIQAVDGVAGVSSIEYRQRGVTPIPVEMWDTVEVASDQIIRVDNDPSRPEHGSLHVEVDGGK
jgi:predicted phage baseplate assembly protein